MRFLRILGVIFMSLVICFIAGSFGLFYNIINPKGLALIPKKTVAAEAEKVRPVLPVKKPEVKIKIVPLAVPKPAVTESRKITNKKPEIVVLPPSAIEKPPVTKEAVTAAANRLNLEQAKLLFDSGKAVFVDARPEYTYIERHIQGAVSLSASRFTFQFEQKKDKLKKEDLYVVYCSSVTCHLSEIVAGYLDENGFKNVRIFTGGWDEWFTAGFPIEGLKVKTNGAK